MAIIKKETSKGVELTLKGRSLWAKLTEPDFHFDKEGTYSTKLILTDDDRDELQEILDAIQEQAVQIAVDEAAKKRQKLKPENVKRADLSLKELIDKETGEGTGEWAYNCKCKASGVTKEGREWARKVPLYDAKAQFITNTRGLEIWNGSILKVSIRLTPFFTSGLGAGVKTQLLAVQILELASGGRDASSFGFGAEEDGFAYEDAPAEGQLPWSDADADADGEGGQADF